MLQLKIGFYIIAFLSYVSMDKSITVVGKAEKAKAGALVISKTGHKGYYINGLAAWDEKVVGKAIKVSGELLIEKFEKQPNGEPIKQTMVGEKLTILKPKWELVR